MGNKFKQNKKDNKQENNEALYWPIIDLLYISYIIMHVAVMLAGAIWIGGYMYKHSVNDAESILKQVLALTATYLIMVASTFIGNKVFDILGLNTTKVCLIEVVSITLVLLNILVCAILYWLTHAVILGVFTIIIEVIVLIIVGLDKAFHSEGELQ